MNALLSYRVWVFVALFWTGGAEAAVVEDVKEALRRAVTFYVEKAAVHGGYVYYYSPDLSQRWGEGRATADQIWVQEPGTPAVGGAFLKAYEATGEQPYLEAAKAAAAALLHGQLASGGWTNAVDFDPAGTQVARYRNGRGKPKGKNFSTLDDGITQGALRFLLRLEKAAPEAVPGLREGIDVGLTALLAAQFANGGFPQGWEGPVEQRAVLSAQYPEYDWRTENRIKNYWEHYTLNDGVAGQVAELLEVAVRLRRDERCKEALVKLGDFLLLAQMPEPQRAWAQQYDAEMRPIWARKFEPPAIAGRESEDAMLTLIQIAKLTREPRFVATLPAARAWMERSLLPDGRLSRYYELITNRPLYMTADYELTFEDARLPKHYGWKTESRLAEIDAALLGLRAGAAEPVAAVPTEVAVREILAALDGEGRWLSRYEGEMLVGQPKFALGEAYVASAVFVERVETLCLFLSQ
jgi:hypothetical protein